MTIDALNKEENKLTYDFIGTNFGWNDVKSLLFYFPLIFYYYVRYVKNVWNRRVKLTVEKIIEIHEAIIEKYGGESGILNRGELEYIVDQVNHESTSIFWKTALILRNITCGHPFLDGNKRTALEVADTYLRMHGYKIATSTKEKVDFMLNLATYGMELDDIIAWLKRYVRKL